MAAPVPSTPYAIRIVGAPRTPLRDAYHAFLRIRWVTAIALLVVTYLLLNALFALGYFELGGVANARRGSYFDAYAFSVQTMGSIGYGAMYPADAAAHVLVIAEAVTSLLVTALATGLVFAKFSRSTARVGFARRVVIAPVDGVPTLMVRLGNERGNLIVEATTRLVLTRTERTIEGAVFYRMYDLPLVRDRSPGLTRSLTVMHQILPGSPLHGVGPEDLRRAESELTISVVGLDNTTTQTVHASHRYMDSDIQWGARYVDIISEEPDGNMLLDLRRFHDVEPTVPTADFPYPARA